MGLENEGMVCGSVEITVWKLGNCVWKWGNVVGNGEMEGAEGCFSCSERGLSVCRGVVGGGKGR